MAKKKPRPSKPASRASQPAPEPHRFTQELTQERRTGYARSIVRPDDTLYALERDLQDLERVLRRYVGSDELLVKLLRFGIGACVRAVDEHNAAAAAVAMKAACQGFYGLMLNDKDSALHAAYAAYVEPLKRGPRVRAANARAKNESLFAKVEVMVKGGRKINAACRTVIRAEAERAGLKLSNEKIRSKSLSLAARYRESRRQLVQVAP